MSHDHREYSARLLFLSFIIFAFGCFFTTERAAAQRGDRPLSPSERMRERQLRREAQMETTLMIETLRKESRRRPGEERASTGSVQLKQDFENLQTVNNQMMTMTFSNNVLDYKLISESSAEIRKRAARLKSKLPLPEAGKDETESKPLKSWDEIDREELKPALLFLDDLIMRFVTNPIFQQPEVVDLQQSSRAKRDLEAIIRLSGKITKHAEKQAKAR